VFISTIKVLGQGITLTAASKLFLLDPIWREALEKQVSKWIFHIGQRAPISHVWKFIILSIWIEEKVKAYHQNHETFIDLVFTEDEDVEMEEGNEPNVAEESN
jgi:SNF2 family DNA or RNA helicase